MQFSDILGYIVDIHIKYSYTVFNMDIIHLIGPNVKRSILRTDKPKRPYRSTRRQAQARQTRQQILAAARRLFIENGYNGATIEAIARQAGVAQETIFAVFGNKRNLLSSLVDFTVGGDERPIALLERAGPQGVLREHDPVQQVHFFAADIANILERVAPIFEVVRMAAKTEADIAELLKNMLAGRMHNLEVFVQQLATHSRLRQGPDIIQATEIVWAISSPEVYNLLTVDRGWTKEKYVHWLGDTLVQLLLQDV
jgi:TetR/AcrR family transcriptional regulator of autoinduction and epiphytic fitness